jgi:acetyltransferase-like isoleucine patch superfamily enzyme
MQTSEKKGIVIGDNVWIGANCSILAGVTIGSNVTIGAGCVIREDIPDNRIVVRDSNSLKLIPKKAYQWDCTKEELV